MLKHKLFIICLFLYLSLFICSLTVGVSPYSHEKSSKNLKEILDKSAAYCEKLASASLYFVCNERIEETRYEHHFVRYYKNLFPRKVEENTYVYDYQLIKQGNRIEEKRILLEENGKKKNEDNAQLKTKVFYSKRSVFGPVGLLNRKNYDQYNYTILDEESVHGRKAIVIEATPKSEMKDMPNYGKVWVDRQDYSILKIEVAEESLLGIEQVKGSIKLGVDPVVSVTHFYDEVYKIDKNQIIRFPSKTVFLHETYLSIRGYRNKVIAAKTQFFYDNYRFFTVDVDVKY